MTDDDAGSQPTGETEAGDLPPGVPDVPGAPEMDLGGLLESAQQAMSAQMEAAQQTVEGTAGGGVVRVTMTGAGEVTEVHLSPDVVDPGDVEMLQDLIVAALNDAGAKVTALQRDALGALGQMDLGGLGGGLDDLLGGSGEPDR